MLIKAYLYESNLLNVVTIEDAKVFASGPHGSASIRIERRGQNFFIKDLRLPTRAIVNNTLVVEAQLQENDQILIDGKYYIFSHLSPEARGTGLKSKNMKWMAQLARLHSVASSDFSVLLLGPSGSGKEVMARAIHQNSHRNSGPFIGVNCSALTETLVESELFGHLRGSFTGAMSDRKGAFEAARGGTLFLDEIGDLSTGLQAKLLRALENSEVRPVGSDGSIKTDVRIIAATHQNLYHKISIAQFREDLYFRLNVVTFNVPSLSERIEDFEDLLYHFAKQNRVRFSFDAIQLLKQHSWPGNVRELRNTVARAAALYPARQIEPYHLSEILDSLSTGNTSSKFNKNLPTYREIERQLILRRLAANNGNQRKTATELGMPKSTLYDRLRLYQIDPQKFRKKKVKE